MAGMLLKNAVIVTQNPDRDILAGDLLIEGRHIAAVGGEIANHAGVPEVDLGGLTVIPGLIQSHVHLCQELFRNHADDLELLDWLQGYIWPMEQAHTPDSLRISAQLGLFELLTSGVSFRAWQTACTRKGR